MASAVWVSSVHSPGAQPNGPPPVISSGASVTEGRAELVGCAEGVPGGRCQDGTHRPVPPHVPTRSVWRFAPSPNSLCCDRHHQGAVLVATDDNPGIAYRQVDD